MEDNIHDDKLDDYVRKSFEGHEEDPPSDMWERVEGDLPNEERPELRVAFWHYRWQAVAAAVILLLFSTLVCEHLYYEQKLRILSEKPATNDIGEAADSRSANNQGTSGSVKVTDSHPAGATVGSNSGKPLLNFKSLGNAQVEQAGANFETVANLAQGKGSNPIIAEGPENRNQLANYSFGATVSHPETYKIIDLDLIAPRIGFVRSSEPPNLFTRQSHFIRRSLDGGGSHGGQTPSPVEALAEAGEPSNPFTRRSLSGGRRTTNPSGWYAGVQATVVSTIEKSHAPVSRPGRRAFVSKQEGRDISSVWWLRAGKKMSTRFSLESGLGYQSTTQTATHTPKFRLADGTHHGPPSVMQRDFNYEINTYNGTATVSLRMETTPGTPLPDEEPVSLSITTSQRLEILRVPLLAKCRIGSGRVQWNAKAGLLGNFILKNELDISARVSQNARFQPVAGTDGYTVQLSQPGKFFLGFWLSAGAEFRLNRHLSLIAEPSLAGDFPRNDKSNRRLPEHFSFGLNAGANYYF